MFDLNITKVLILAVLAVVIFGPEQLPKIAAQAGRTLRELRKMAEGARDDLKEGLGPGFEDFDIADLNPRHFVRKHLLEGLDTDGPDPAAAGEPVPVPLEPGEPAPYDAEAT